jgi:archaellum component FlaC
VTDRAADPEQQAKEDYMRRLMCFRKDELILPEESNESDSDENEKNNGNPKKKKEVAGIEAAYEFVEDVENKMSKIGDVIRGMDKRMSYNLRLVGSVIASDFKELD